MKILLASPRGFCAGVNMAIEALERALQHYGTPMYVFHEIVHNKHIVDSFRGRGVVFVNEVDEVPYGGRLMYSAHGIAPQVQAAAEARNLQVIDATCPLVRKVHWQAIKFARQEYTIILVGHKGHDEVIGTMGEAPDRMILVETVEDVDRLTVADPNRVAYLTQTTLSVDEAAVIINRLKERFPNCVGSPKEDICYATQNRQEALKAVLDRADVVLVVGSKNSSNSNRLAEIAREHAKPSYLIDSAADIRPEWFRNEDAVLITAGASAPEHLVTGCIDYLQERFAAVVEHHTTREENVEFPLPVELRGLVQLDATLPSTPNVLT